MSETHRCPMCGYQWEYGQNGEHSCAVRLKDRQKTLEAVIEVYAFTLEYVLLLGDDIMTRGQIAAARAAYHDATGEDVPYPTKRER